MARANFQVLVLLFCRGTETEYGVLHRADMDAWQFVAGGGEDDETPAQAARRELWEETGLRAERLFALDTCCSVPADCFKPEDRARWGKDCYVVQEHAFAAEVPEKALSLSREHTECAWLPYEEAKNRLRYDSNRTALWELRERIDAGNLREETADLS